MESAVNQDETITSSRADDVELNIERETFIQMEGNPSQEYLDNITSDFWDNDPESKRSRRKQGMSLKRTKNDDIGLKDNDTEIDIYKFDEELHFLEGTSDQELSSEQMDITGQHKKSRKQFKPCRVTSEQKSDDADNEYLSEDDNDDEPAEVMETIFKIIEKLSTSGVKQSDDDEISRKRRRKMKKYQCSLCSFNTKDSYTLGQHMRWHIGDRPYVCRGCSKDFTRADHLRRHVEGAHPGQLDYFLRCIYEDYNAKLKETFLSHVNDSPSLDTLLTTSVMKSGMQTPTSIGLVSHITNSSEQSSTLQEANSVANVKFHRNKPIKVANV
uniref:Myoneurin-like n=1 Tax=Saccoglossus kowalevskii TaxID=10224 RepID=A0ABM0MHJ9_SACKO|nr:PREDICTED: myoneurin-like [Saccoglossus kowalevskii]